MHSLFSHFGRQDKVKHGDTPFFVALAAVFFSAALVFTIVRAQGSLNITAGPSVAESLLTTDSAVIQWTTDRESTSIVYYGTTPSLEQSPYRKIVPISEEEITEINHGMTLQELKSGTTYYYKVRSAADGVIAESAVGTFRTKEAAPVAPEPTPEPVVEPKPEPVTEEVKPVESTPVKEPVVEPKPEPQPEPKPQPKPVVEPKPEPRPEPPPPTQPAPTEEVVVPVETPPAVPLVTALTDNVDQLKTDIFQALEGSLLPPTVLPPTPAVPPPVGAPAPAAPPAPTIPAECVENGILPERCAAWLEARYADRSCAEQGLLTKESCESYLLAKNAGVFPGCEGKTEEECGRVKALTTIGYLPAAVRSKADEVISQLIETKTVVDIPGLTPVKSEVIEDATWWRSVAAPGAETSAGVLVLDADKDGLPDDYEVGKGTDPKQADTDGDGVSDGEELKQGTDPLSTSKLAAALDPTEQVIVFRRPLGQPRGEGEVDPTFAAAPVQPAPDAADKKTVITGRCAPRSTCIIFVYSYIPMVLTTSTDENGNFTYDLSASVVDGAHTVYVAVTDETGKIAKKSNPLALFVKEAQAVSADDFLRPDVAQAATVNVEETTVAMERRTYLYAVIPLIVLGLAGIWYFLLRKKPGSAA